MSSEVIEEIIRRAPNLCGVKLTCGGSIAKLVRLTAAVKESPNINEERAFPFLFLDGLIADLTPVGRNFPKYYSLIELIHKLKPCCGML